MLYIYVVVRDTALHLTQVFILCCFHLFLIRSDCQAVGLLESTAEYILRDLQPVAVSPADDRCASKFSCMYYGEHIIIRG